MAVGRNLTYSKFCSIEFSPIAYSISFRMSEFLILSEFSRVDFIDDN